MSDEIPASAMQAAREHVRKSLGLPANWRPDCKTMHQSIESLARAMHAYAEQQRTFKNRTADALADEVAVLVHRRVIDSRSPAGDALLDFRNPPSTHRLQRFAALEDQVAELTKRLQEALDAQAGSVRDLLDFADQRDKAYAHQHALRAELERVLEGQRLGALPVLEQLQKTIRDALVVDAARKQAQDKLAIAVEALKNILKRDDSETEMQIYAEAALAKIGYEQ